MTIVTLDVRTDEKPRDHFEGQGKAKDDLKRPEDSFSLVFPGIDYKLRF